MIKNYVFNLTLKFPPVLVTFLFGFLAWLLILVGPDIELPWVARIILCASISALGLILCGMGVHVFSTRGTTVNPVSPDRASCLITTGIYSVTRNPMYLGFLCILIAWAIFLGNAFSLFSPAGFIMYLNRYQIIPEESILHQKFGDEFVQYKLKVKRWL